MVSIGRSPDADSNPQSSGQTITLMTVSTIQPGTGSVSS